jgi:dynein heavy chain
MRALRDFNLPKIVTDDKPIFIRLIEDLFPNAKPEKRNHQTSKIMRGYH